MSTVTEVPKSTPLDGAVASDDAFQVIELDGDTISFHNFTFRSPDVVSFLGGFAEEERSLATQRAIEVGAYCLDRASAAKDTEVMKRQIERLLNETETKVAAIPAAVQAELLKKVGAGEGQVLKPVIDTASTIARDLIQRISDLKQLYGEQLDPAKDSSTLGKTLKSLTDLLDPQRKDSVQGAVDSAVSKITGEDGALAKSVKAVVADAMKPLKDELDSLAKEIRGQEAAQEAVMQTIEKGAPFEDDVVAQLQPWAKGMGAHVEHVGADNRPGDIMVGIPDPTLAAIDVQIVIETRDRQTAVGRKAIADDLAKKMAERQANAAIYLSRSPAGLAREIGDWAEGVCDAGPWVATTPDHLQAAIRLLAVLVRLRARSTENCEFDAAQMASQIQRIRTAIDRVRTIRTKANKVRESADEINTESESLRDEIRESLTLIEEALRKVESTNP